MIDTCVLFENGEDKSIPNIRTPRVKFSYRDHQENSLKSFSPENLLKFSCLTKEKSLRRILQDISENKFGELLEQSLPRTFLSQISGPIS